MDSQLPNNKGRITEVIVLFPNGKLFWVDRVDNMVFIMAGNRIVEIMVDNPTMSTWMELFAATLNEVAEEWLKYREDLSASSPS